MKNKQYFAFSIALGENTDVSNTAQQVESEIVIVNDENKTITDPVKMANTFNTYFSTIGSKLASKIDKPSNNCNYSCNSYISNKMTSFFLNPITMYDIVKHK